MLRFAFVRGEAAGEDVIDGSVTGLRPILDKLTSWERESIRLNGGRITDLRPKRPEDVQASS